MMKGRISTKWSDAQSIFYRDFPDTTAKKTCTGLGWSIRIIKELTTMSLTMWNNRCGCMHGHDEAEEKRIEKEKLRVLIQDCYLKKDVVPVEFHRMFSSPLCHLISRHSITYLNAWIEKYKAHARGKVYYKLARD